MELDEYLPVLEKTNARFADAAAEAVLEHGWKAPVPGCPNWKLDDLVWHLSEVQHFWAWVVRTRAPDPSTYVEPARHPGQPGTGACQPCSSTASAAASANRALVFSRTGRYSSSSIAPPRAAVGGHPTLGQEPGEREPSGARRKIVRTPL